MTNVRYLFADLHICMSSSLFHIFAVTIAVVVIIANIIANEHLSVKIACLFGMIFAVWFAFGITADGPEITQVESIV